ncbi:MAG: hypothetical protein Q8P16_02770 [bacterium]|nr:hypothetical protein [bacterium]
MDRYTGAAIQQGEGLAGIFNPAILSGIFWAVVAFFFIYTVILMYHWFTFSMRRDIAVMAAILYFFISVVLLFAMGASVVSLTTGI